MDIGDFFENLKKKFSCLKIEIISLTQKLEPLDKNDFNKKVLYLKMATFLLKTFFSSDYSF